MTAGFDENSFVISNGPQVNRSPGHGLFLLLSRFNRSCVPNSKIIITDGENSASLRLKDIISSEEITLYDNTDFKGRNRDERHHALRFICDYKACPSGTHFQQVSDMRRPFLRGYSTLRFDVDLNGEKQDCPSPIIIDSQLNSHKVPSKKLNEDQNEVPVWNHIDNGNIKK
ncbi:hypothetical protein P152DRAFT_15631 [Eremomyces bilateralis CBS 781.70]|uniref:Uncharacterized protein n=1 Tax=Eremomyces bilateralis CBS 781.70 TaxID=1392243 RepID=A0A6G1GGV6_9PEZI|nr:uncharacterized protein P152DRAFT_15631 [Eremomyces bilateralis CBS 781.70]KAF1817335.1 hypothetical protein P152DRAFT_15631 [Eremomyces bilateralis CBS 781.70]